MGHMANTQLHEELFAGSPGETENNIAVASTSAEAELEEAEEDEEEQGKEIFPIPKCGARKDCNRNQAPAFLFFLSGLE